MKIKFLALWGRANCGKTTTIKSVYDKLLEDASTKVVLSEFLPQVDILAVVEFKGVIVGVVSQGDVGDWLESYLEKLLKHNCEIILCATRTRGATVQAVLKFEKSNDVDWIEQSIAEAPQQSTANKKMANKIMAAITESIA